MKNWLFLTTLLLLTACSDNRLAGESSNSTSNSQVTLTEQYAGRWVVINYWAQWCKPCLEEIPELNALAEKYPNIAVLGVNFDGATGEELATQVAKFEIQFPVLAVDPAEQLGTTRPVVLPTTLILNPEGVLVGTLIGPQTLQSLALATQRTTIARSEAKPN